MRAPNMDMDNEDQEILSQIWEIDAAAKSDATSDAVTEAPPSISGRRRAGRKTNAERAERAAKAAANDATRESGGVGMAERIKAAPEPSGATEPAKDPTSFDPADPFFVEGMEFLSNEGMKKLEKRMELEDPGDAYRRKISEAFGRLMGRLKPVQPGPMSDGIIIASSLLFWVAFGRKEKPKP